MKHKFLSGCLALALGGTASSQTADFYVNDGILNCPPLVPPQIDATNFVNNNFFSINFTNFTENSQQYETASTLNFTNNGLMIGNSGYQFDKGPTGAGQRRMAANFVNRGLISVGSVGNTNVFFNFFFGFGFGFGGGFAPRLFISATNVVSPGTNVVGVDGLFHLEGKTVDLDRGDITMEGFEDTVNSISTVGLFDGYWGVGTNAMNPFFQFQRSPPQTPSHFVATPGGLGFFQILSLPAATAYVRTLFAGPPDFTNRFVQAVFLNNTNSAVTNNVYFPSLGQIDVEWIAIHTNVVTGATGTNYLYLFDDFGTFDTNMLVQTVPNLTFRPLNYSFFRGGRLALGAPRPSGLPAGTFDNLIVTNDFAAYRAVFAPTTQLPRNVPGLSVTNLPGRIEIAAGTVLNLSRTRITGLNYMNLRATNHFFGSRGAEVSVPLSDITLASTNGNMAITNLLPASIPRFTGDVDLWSGRWTNVGGGFLSQYHVLFVDSRLNPTAPALVQDLSLRSTNVAISDILNVTRNFLIDAERLTIVTNVAPAPTPTGEINLLSSQIIWSTSLPRLQYLTNNGVIRVLNAMFFGGSRSTPFFTSNFNEPYIAFVNRGAVTNEGSLIWADYFENDSLFTSGSGFGSITLKSKTALLTNGFFLTSAGDISITSGVLTNINHVLQAGRKLTLNVTDVLTDAITNTITVTVVTNAIPITLTIVSNANSWTAGNGVDLPVKPRLGDLLGTTILDSAPAGAEVRHLWAAEDRGCSPAGYKDNAALGRLILDGGYDSQFTFTGTGVSNALYVDYLELRNFTTNIDFSGNLAGVQIDPNMTIYFAQAVMNGVSVAERLNGKNGGGFCWASNYAGIYSSTNLFYGGATNTLNVALVQSKNLDSDCDGLFPNVDDSEPIFLVTTPGLPEATNNTAYSVQLQAGGGPSSPHRWALVPGSEGLPNGLSLSSDGLVSGTPTQTGFFAFTARASVTTPCGVLTADRSLTINVSPGVLAIAVALVSQPSPGALVSWPGIPNSTNFLYFKVSPWEDNWHLLTNFGVGGAVPARVSVFDPMAATATRFYRVQVSTQH